jgi:hypothetical protein
MQRSLKRKAVTAVAVLAVAAFAGGAFAATQQKPLDARKVFLNDVAQRLHVTTAQLQSAIRGALLDQLNTAVADGKLTKTQATAIRRQLQIGGGMPLVGLFGLGNFGIFGPDRPAVPAAPVPRVGPNGRAAAPRWARPPARMPRFKGRGPGFPGDPLSEFGAASGYLGLTPAKLLSQLRSGKTLAQIASADGKTAGGLEGAIVAQHKRLLDKLVAAKRLTRAQEARRVARFAQRVAKLMDATHPLERLMLRPAVVFGGHARGWFGP